jgi:3-oxosteroid 1-dehydrogenase
MNDDLAFSRKMAKEWDDSFDFVIVGSGGGSMCAALLLKDLGRRALIVEKQARVGGSTGYSGGVWWVPNNPLMAREGIPDSYEKARQYLDAAVDRAGNPGPGSSPARREAFLRTGPEMVGFLERKGMIFERPEGWSDYYDDLPGGEPRSRSLIPRLFDVNELGDWKGRLSMYPAPVPPLGYDEFTPLFLAKTNWAGKKVAMKMVWRMLTQKLTGKDYRGGGAAIQGRMLQIALREKLDIWTDAPVEEFVVDNGRVTGVIVRRQGRTLRIEGREGVLINAGGFSHNAEMRRKYQPQPSAERWTNANPGDTGEMIEAAIRLGAACDLMDEAWWVVTSLGPNRELPEGAVAPNGAPVPFMHHIDLSFPHSLMVDQLGKRFCDEAGAYMEIGQRLYRRHHETGKGIPAWVILESRHRDNYPWGTALPGKTPKSWLDSGYMIKADTLDELALRCGIDWNGLQAEVERFNGFCRTGRDEDFQRGGRAFDRYHGDPTVKPNPNLGAIEKGPFYAVRIYPGDVGTSGGVVTDEFARVLRADGSPIPGLYATGNSTASVVGRCYPGAGASIAASFVFAYLAARHAAGQAASRTTNSRKQTTEIGT